MEASSHTVEANDPDHGIDPLVYARRWSILGVLCLSLLIVIIGNTTLNVALPTLARELDASTTSLQWMVDAYSLIFAGMLFTAGTIGDRFGRKGALQFGLVLFMAGARLRRVRRHVGQVIGGRAIMGLAAAFVMPSTLSILTNVFPAHERTQAIAIWAGVSGGGAAIGPIASGLLLEHFWWGSVFLVNVPVIMHRRWSPARSCSPRSKDPGEHPIDVPGAALSIVALSSLVYGIIEGPHNGWTSPTTLGAFAVSAVAIAGSSGGSRPPRNPMLDLKLFRDRRFSVASGGMTLTFFAMFGTFFLLAQYLQLVLGYSPLESGLLQLPFAFIIMFVAPAGATVRHAASASAVGRAGRHDLHRHRARAAVAAGGRQLAVERLLVDDPAGHRHGDLDDAADVADHVVGAARPGRRRLGDERHDPRTRWRPRRRRARLDRHLEVHQRDGVRPSPACPSRRADVADSGLTGALARRSADRRRPGCRPDRQRPPGVRRRARRGGDRRLARRALRRHRGASAPAALGDAFTGEATTYNQAPAAPIDDVRSTPTSNVTARVRRGR